MEINSLNSIENEFEIISIYLGNITLKVDTLDGLYEILFGSLELLVTISTSSEDEDVTVTPFIVTEVGAPISRIGTQGVDTGAGPEFVWLRAPTVANLVMFDPDLLVPDVYSCDCFFILICINKLLFLHGPTCYIFKTRAFDNFGPKYTSFQT